MSCTESSCGTTHVTPKYFGYSAIVQIEGEFCPPFLRISLDYNLKFLRIHPSDKHGQGIEWPQSTKKDEMVVQKPPQVSFQIFLTPYPEY